MMRTDFGPTLRWLTQPRNTARLKGLVTHSA